jgi:hypothetical protein
MKKIWRWIVLPAIFVLTLVVLIEGGGARAVQSYQVRLTGEEAHVCYLPIITCQTDTTVNCTDADGDGYAIEGGDCGLVDCDDAAFEVNPGADEVCTNGIDDDCDGKIDAADIDCMPNCTDADDDGYAVEGGACGPVDCDDSKPGVNPGADEVCTNGIDDDCDGKIDAADNDCMPNCTDADDDGYAIEGGDCGLVDCDDADPDVNPGATEVCNNGVNDDCSELIDADGDGFAVEDGDCVAVDCNDTRANVNPGAREFCANGLDDDCDDSIDEDEGGNICCTDVDEDGYAVDALDGYCGLADCNDEDPDVNPGAQEICDDRRIDDDCDGCRDMTDYEFWPCTDADGDGDSVEGGWCGAVDCNDANASIHPGAAEVCGNGIDDNCNGYTDTEPPCMTCIDADGDGYATNGGACGPVDCNDANSAINPGAEVVCDDGIDEDCDGLLDADEPYCDASIKNIIVIGWDGTQRDHFWQCYNKILPECPDGLPNIKELSSGRIFNSTVTNGETSTKPGWVQILSGYNADVTGVYSLENYQPVPLGYTVFEKIENHFGPENIVSMFISAKSYNTSNACQRDKIYKVDQLCVEDIGQPWCDNSEYIDYFELDKVLNDKLGGRALQLIEENRNRLFFAFFLFQDPDATGHREGENSTEYTEQMIEVDDWLGQIISKTVELGLDDRTLIYVTTDHGFDEGMSWHLNAPYGFFASNDTGIVRSGDRKDVAPTILEKYGISRGAIGPAPAVDGYSLLHPNPLACIPEGEAFVDYTGAPECCDGLNLIPLTIPIGDGCKEPTGAGWIADDSGYCTDCGNGVCEAPENRCNCPDDC